ncbi:GntR family transcriptional regulator [Micromonospora fluostatini]|uniref:GntR family transcriptional regulator n=1 Tax=Micromonospora sp. JCM 30529 TaxID=3421643 RepID=UPI003D1764F1
MLKERIRAGQGVPSTLHISQEFGINRITARRALDVLVGEGWIVVRQGYGPVVLERDDGGEIETVRLPRGATLDIRQATEQDRYDLGLPLSMVVAVAEVSIGGRSRIYRADRTRFTSA